MIDWHVLMIWCIIAVSTFLIVRLALCCTSKRGSREEAASEEKKKRTPRQWFMDISLVGAVLFFIVFPLHVILTLFISVPLSAIILFAIALVRYCLVKKRQKKDPEAVTAEEIAFYRKHLIIFSVILAVVMIAFACMLFQPADDIAYM